MSFTAQELDDIVTRRKNVQLSPHFSLNEMVATSHTEINNWPQEAEIVQNLQRCCETLLETVRARYNKPIHVNSGYRCPALNTKVHGSATSQHMTGDAVDFEIAGIANGDICAWIRDNMTFGQLILEFYTLGQPSSGWVHCSAVPPPGHKAGEVLTAVKDAATGKTKYLPGLHV